MRQLVQAKPYMSTFR